MRCTIVVLLAVFLLLVQPVSGQRGTFSGRVAEHHLGPQKTLPAFVRQKLTELDSFKGSESFRRYGFGRGGPHHRWLEQVEQRYMNEDRKAPLGDLLQLGMEYSRTGGRESHYSVFARQEILKSVGEERRAEPEPEPEQPQPSDAQEVIQKIPKALQEAHALSKTDPAGAAKMLEEYHARLLASQEAGAVSGRVSNRIYYLGVLESRITEYRAKAGE